MARHVEYHSTEVRVTIGRPNVYQASCDCGWRGREQDGWRNAADDGTAHEMANNEGSPPRAVEAE